MLKEVIKNKKIVIYFLIVIFIPILIPICTTIIEIIVALGRNFGTFLRNIVEGVCCLR